VRRIERGSSDSQPHVFAAVDFIDLM
jgi:hypothetical protein